MKLEIESLTSRIQETRELDILLRQALQQMCSLHDNLHRESSFEPETQKFLQCYEKGAEQIQALLRQNETLLQHLTDMRERLSAFLSIQ